MNATPHNAERPHEGACVYPLPSPALRLPSGESASSPCSARRQLAVLRPASLFEPLENIGAQFSNTDEAGVCWLLCPDSSRTRRFVGVFPRAKSRPFPFHHVNNFAHALNSSSVRRGSEHSEGAVAWLQKGFAG